MSHKRKLIIPVASAILIACAFVLVISRTKLHKTVATKASAPAKPTPTPGPRTLVSEVHLRSGGILPQLHFALKALGDRLEQTGKERLLLAGVFRSYADAQPIQFILVSELPGRVRVTMQSGISQRTLLFDGQRPTSSDTKLEQADLALLETLAYDTPDRFFMGQMGETTPRLLGSHFRADDGSQSAYAGPYYDIYQVDDTVKADITARRQSKLYYFNSTTQLLERVRYNSPRNGVPVEVEVQLDDWRPLQNQRIAYRVVRLENGKPVFAVTIASASVGPSVNDGIFSAP